MKESPIFLKSAARNSLTFPPSDHFCVSFYMNFKAIKLELFSFVKKVTHDIIISESSLNIVVEHRTISSIH